MRRKSRSSPQSIAQRSRDSSRRSTWIAPAIAPSCSPTAPCARAEVNFTKRTATLGANTKVADIDGDGDLDIGIGSIDVSIDGRRGMFTLLRNDGGTFSDPWEQCFQPWCDSCPLSCVCFEPGCSCVGTVFTVCRLKTPYDIHRNAYDVEFIDVDRDGRLDVFLAGETRYFVFLNAGPSPNQP